MWKLVLLWTAFVSGDDKELPQKYIYDDYPYCNYPLGVESGAIPDEQITATKSHAETAAPKYARLNTKDGAGAWCHPYIDREDDQQYLQIELNGLAEVNLIALQSRYNGQESAELLKLNVSRDGIEYHSIGQIEGHDGKNSSVTEHRAIEPVVIKFIRFIPIVDRAMPVCIRTELFGCYRTDGLEYYQLSKSPQSPDMSLDRDQLTGIGKLADNKTEDYIQFSPSELEMKFVWDQPQNVSQIQLYTLQNSYVSGCLKKAIVTLPTTKQAHRFDFDCSKGSTNGRKTIPLVLSNAAFSDEFHIKLLYTGELMISEIQWLSSLDTSEVRIATPVMVSVEDASLMDNEYILLAIVIVCCLLIMMLLFTCVAVFRKRFQASKPNYTSSSTLREGTWFNLVPNDSDVQKGSYDFENRSDMHLVQNNFAQVSPAHRPLTSQNSFAVRYAPCSIPSYTTCGKMSYNSQNLPVTKHAEFGHEYSEIGSITADSGRGDSLNGCNTGIIEEQHYAQVTY